MKSAADLEPVTPDPRKLRRTAWILVAIMVLGGWLVLRYYEQWSARKANDERPARVHQIRKERDLRMVRQDGKIVDLFELRGAVWAVNTVSLGNPELSARSLGVMRRLAEKYNVSSDFKLVSLVVDPPSEAELLPSLEKFAGAQGMDLPYWWLGGTQAATMHKFIKNELKTAVFPHQEDSVWKFDTSIILIDREGHVRRAVVPQQRGGPPYVATFDFDQAAAWDEKDVLTGTELNNEQQLEQLLIKTIDLLLAEIPEKR
jgi:hypothetical protein